MVHAIESSNIIRKEVLYKKCLQYSNYILKFVCNRKQFYLHHGIFSFLFCYFKLYQLSLNPICRFQLAESLLCTFLRLLLQIQYVM